MAGVTKRIWVLAVVSLGAALLVSCGSSDTERGAAPQSTGAQPGPAVEEYLHILLPGFAAIRGLDQLDPEFYASIVSGFREGGLEALDDVDRSQLLLVAQVAFLSHAETLRWSVTSGDVSAGAEPSHDGEATVEEIYVRRPYSPTESTVPRLAARRGKTDSIGWSWGLTPYWDPDCRGELWLMVEFVSEAQQSDGEKVVVTEWGMADGEWRCYRIGPASSYRYYAAELDYWGTFVRLANAVLTGREALDGEAAYRFEDYQDRSVQYWLDAETLWLRQYQYEDSSGALITVKLEAVNAPINIEPPDVDVPCAE